MSQHFNKTPSKHDIAPHKRQRSYLREYLRLPLHRNQIIKKIKLGQTTFRKNVKQQLGFPIGQDSRSAKKYPFHQKSPRSFHTQRSKLTLDDTKQKDISSLKAIKNSLVAKSLRSSTDIKQDNTKSVNEIKAIIDRIVIANRNKRHIIQNNSRIKFDDEEVRLTTSNLKATQHYYNVKRYYEKKYSSGERILLN